MLYAKAVTPKIHFCLHSSFTVRYKVWGLFVSWDLFVCTDGCK